MNNKPGGGSSAKLGAGPQGKSSGGKSGLLGAGTSGKSSGGLGLERKSNALSPKITSDKSYSSPASFGSSRSSKSKGGFGILWIPTKRHNRHKKDMVFNSHRDDRTRERSPSMYNIMSGDSPDNQVHKKKEEETALLVPDRVKAPATTLSSSVIIADASHLQKEESSGCEEKQGFIQRDKDDSKEASGDANEKDDKEFLENNDSDANKYPELKSSDNKWEKNKLGDKVDSVYLRQPPAHKARSTTSTTVEDEGCGIKCLYYTLQCCDCVLM